MQIFVSLVLIFLLTLPSAHGEIDSVQNKIVKISDEGVSPQTTELSRGGTSVFFLNSTSNSLLGIEIVYGKRLAYCASGGMLMHPDGVFRSLRPFTPQHFTAACFPEPGKYEIRLHGRGSQKQVDTAYVLVAE